MSVQQSEPFTVESDGLLLHGSITRYYDLAPAAQLGLATAWIARQDETWPAGEPPPDLVVRDLAELERVLG